MHCSELIELIELIKLIVLVELTLGLILALTVPRAAPSISAKGLMTNINTQVSMYWEPWLSSRPRIRGLTLDSSFLCMRSATNLKCPMWTWTFLNIKLPTSPILPSRRLPSLGWADTASRPVRKAPVLPQMAERNERLMNRMATAPPRRGQRGIDIYQLHGELEQRMRPVFVRILTTHHSNECKRRKIKCNGNTPCQRCGNLNL